MQTFDLRGLRVNDDLSRGCAWDARGDRLAVCARDALWVFSRAVPSAPVRFDVGDATPRCAAFSPDGALLAVGTDLGARAVVVFDAATATARGTAIAFHADHGDTIGRLPDLVTNVAFSPRGDLVAVAGASVRGVLRAADGWGGAIAWHDPGGSSLTYFETTSLDFTPDGRAVVWSDEFAFTRASVAALGGAAHPVDTLSDRATVALEGPNHLGPLRPAGRAAFRADGGRTTLAMRQARGGRPVLVRLVGGRATAVLATGDGASGRLDALHVDDARGALWCDRKGGLYRMRAETGALTRIAPCAGVDRRPPVAVVVSGDGASVARVLRDAAVTTRVVARRG